jgi:D-sedoheptulose 7-phosphate isomerase
MSNPYITDFLAYTERLNQVLKGADWDAVGRLTAALRKCWRNGNRLYLCGNGGSAGNAMHVANDLFYGIAKGNGLGLSAQALPSNVSLLTCLANDEGYAEIYSRQLAVDGRKGDILAVFSGSGNSPNILRVLEQAQQMGIESYAILGFSGGKAKAMADVPIHFAIDDMQISEDVQLIVFHMIMQWLLRNGPGEA